MGSFLVSVHMIAVTVVQLVSAVVVGIVGICRPQTWCLRLCVGGKFLRWLIPFISAQPPVGSYRLTWQTWTSSSYTLPPCECCLLSPSWDGVAVLLELDDDFGSCFLCVANLWIWFWVYIASFLNRLYQMQHALTSSLLRPSNVSSLIDPYTFWFRMSFVWGLSHIHVVTTISEHSSLLLSVGYKNGELIIISYEQVEAKKQTWL